MKVFGALFLFSSLILFHFCNTSSGSVSSLPLDGCNLCVCVCYSIGTEVVESPLKICSHSRSTCCDCAKDMHLQHRFQALNVSNPERASLFKSLSCAVCDRFSAELLKREPNLINVSSLCSSKFLLTSSLSQGNASTEFCTKVLETCGSISIHNPSPLEQGFSEAFGRPLDDEALCFNCENISYSEMETPHPPDGLCLEKIGNGAYINMVPHPDGSNRVFVSNMQGKIWLATVPDEGSNGILGIAESKPFLDLTDKVAYDTRLGLMGMAFHPNFLQNGRFFLSFNCDKMKQPGCVGRCSCNTDVDCDPSKLGTDNGIVPCQYHTIIAEYTVNDTASKPSLSKRAYAAEVRRILTMGLPYSGGHAGQILFGPADGYLYLMIADGTQRDDPSNFAQNKKSLLGKILRIDIDHIPSAMEINKLGLWGNYSIPKDNPYVDDKELEPAIWALGFKNPWRCSFDSKRPSYFICGDSGEDRYEEVDIVTKGGNYGWRVYEGHSIFHPAKSPGGNTSATSINPIFPVMGYYHSETGINVGSASIAAGYFYRSMTDPCMYGRYLYMDLYAGALWAGSENPENSGNFTTTRIPFRCSHDSPIQCSFPARSSLLPDLGYVFSFAEDNKRDIHILTSTGVYRITRPSHCNFTCPKEKYANAIPTPHSSSSMSKNIKSGCRSRKLFVFFSSLMLLVLDIYL
ncbi:hypothetical protein ACOSQ4_024657 [Xanthoceras sorbifolium]